MRYALAVAALLLPALLPLGSAEVDPAPEVGEWIEAEFRITYQNLTRYAIDAGFDARKVTIDNFLYTAQDIRDVWTGLRPVPQGREAFKREVETTVETRFSDALASVFPDAEIAVAVEPIDEAILEVPGTAYDPPVPLRATATVSTSYAALQIESARVTVNDDTVEALFDMGAEVSQSLALRAPAGWNATYRVALPTGLVFTTASGGAVGPDKTTAVWHVSAWTSSAAQDVAAELGVRDRLAPTYDAQDAAVLVIVDMKDIVGLAIPGALSGDLGTLKIEITVQATLRVISLPTDFAAKMPSGVSIPFLNSDAIRIALDAGILTTQDIDKIEQDLRGTVDERLSAIFGGSVASTGGIDRNGLQSNLISTPADAIPAVAFQAKASVNYDLSRRPAITLYSFPQTFQLAQFQGLPTTYRIVLPRGLQAGGIDAPGAQVATGKSADGREQVEITPTSSEVRATMTIAVTEGFIIEKFWYVLLAVILVIVLILLGVFALLRRRRRGKATPQEPPPEQPGPT